MNRESQQNWENNEIREGSWGPHAKELHVLPRLVATIFFKRKEINNWSKKMILIEICEGGFMARGNRSHIKGKKSQYAKRKKGGQINNGGRTFFSLQIKEGVTHKKGINKKEAIRRTSSRERGSFNLSFLIKVRGISKAEKKPLLTELY